MRQRILTPSRYPVLRIPVFSGGASGELYAMEKDPNYGINYRTPLAIATKKDTSGQKKLESAGVRVIVHPRPEGMKFRDWSAELVYVINLNLPEGYINDVLLLLTGCDMLVKGQEFREAIGNRVINVHPAPLYILTHTETGEVVDVHGMDPAMVRQRYPLATRTTPGYKRRYTGWGEDIMPMIMKERHAGASTVHIATEETDAGPCITYREKEREERHLENPSLFQSELKTHGDGPAIAVATKMILEGLEIDKETQTLFWRNAPLPYEGLEIPQQFNSDLTEYLHNEIWNKSSA